MGKHALLSASSSHRWLACTPSARLCENYEDAGSEYAQQGTDAHSLCEHKLKLALSMETTDPTESLSFYDEEMEECACGYAEYVLSLVEEAKKNCKDPVVLIEQKLDFSRFVKDGFGTGDCVVIADGTLYIIDYKHGKGVEVFAAENPQMMLYALGALELFDGIYDIDTVRMAIYQPRRENVSVCVIAKDDLLQWAYNDLMAKAKLAYDGEGEFNAGEHCRFCKAKAVCRKRAEYNLELAKYDFEMPATLIIEPAEAEVVKRIYREYLQGSSLKQIGESLESDGILTAAGKPTWRAETLKKILQNEKYIGDALLQKTYTVDFLTKKRVKNNGIVPQYYVTDDHEAIIPRDLYMQVQEEMQRRSNLHSGKNRKKRVYSSKYALSSIVYCSKCGDIYRRIAWNNRGKRSNVWRCVTRVESGPDACDADTIQETELQEAVIKAINSVLSQKSTAIGVLQENIEEVLKQENSPTKDVDGKLEKLQKQLLQKANRNEQYDDLVEEIYKLREEKQQILADKAEMEGVKQSIFNMKAFLNSQTTEIEEYDEQLVRRLIARVTVYDERFEVELKSGLSVEIKRIK